MLQSILITKSKTSIKLIKSLIVAFLPVIGSAQYITKYPEMPRIDVHAHPHSVVHHESAATTTALDARAVNNYLALSDTLRLTNRVELAMWINLGGDEGIDAADTASNGRIMTCISDYSPQRGLKYKPADIKKSLNEGYAGYKMWFASYWRRLKEGEKGIKYIDDPAVEPVLGAMEDAGMPCAAVHVADPNGPFWNRGRWCADPVEYWRMIIGLERVLHKHPKLVVMAAHGAWLVCQDAQLDFLRYLFKTYPNFHIDLAATDQYYHLVNYENLRSLFIEYSDRILFGTDIGIIGKNDIALLAEKYMKSFQILETDNIVKGGFFGTTDIKGLNLPKEVLEKIYYKNALRIYPGLKERMEKLGRPCPVL